MRKRVSCKKLCMLQRCIKPKLLPRHSPQRVPNLGRGNPLTKPSNQSDTRPKSEPALELISRAAPSVEAYHRSVSPDAGGNSGRRRIKKLLLNKRNSFLVFYLYCSCCWQFFVVLVSVVDVPDFWGRESGQRKKYFSHRLRKRLELARTRTIVNVDVWNWFMTSHNLRVTTCMMTYCSIDRIIL